MKYSERGRHNPYDAYIMGFCVWMSPRQIILVEDALRTYKPNPGIEAAAHEDVWSQFRAEAEIKRKKYLGAV